VRVTSVCYAQSIDRILPIIQFHCRATAFVFEGIACLSTASLRTVLYMIFVTIFKEDDAFWLLTTLVDDILPTSNYGKELLGCYIDQVYFTQK